MPDNEKTIKTTLELDIDSYSKNAGKAADKTEELGDRVDELKEDVKDLGEQSKKSGKETENSFDKIIKKALGFAAVSAVIKSSWQNAIQLNRYTLTLNETLGESVNIAQDFADEFSRASSISKTSIQSMQAQLSTILRQYYSDKSVIATLSNDMIRQVEKIATSTGRTYDEVLSRYQSLINGSWNAFLDLGIDTREEILRTSKTFEEFANGRAWQELTDNEKKQIAIIETMRQANDKFEVQTDSLVYKQNKLAASWENVTTSIGGLLSVATPVLDFFSAVFNTVSEGIDVLDSLGDGVTFTVIGFSAFVAFAPSIIKMLQMLFTSAMSTQSAFMLLGSSILMIALIAAQFSKTEDNIADNADVGTGALKEQEKQAEKTQKALEGLMGIDEINTLRQISGSNLIQDEEGNLSFDTRSDYLEEYFEKMHEGQQQMMKDSQDAAKQFEDQNKMMVRVMTTIAGVTLGYSAMTLAIKAVNAILAIKRARTAADTAETNINTASIEAKTNAERGNIIAGQASVAQSNANAKAAHAEATAELGAAAGHAAKNTAATWGAWAAIGLPIIAAIIGGVVGFASTIKMAHGGVVNQETQATIGEGVHHEAVIPLGNSPEWTDTKRDLADYLIEGLSDGRKSGTTQVTVTLNGREIAQATSEDIHNDWKRRGWI